jgi:uncharacterized membrane protein YfcA
VRSWCLAPPRWRLSDVVSGGEFAVVSVVVALGSSVQASLGFGLGLLGAPVIALIDPTLVPGTLIMLATTLTVMIVVREREHLDLRGAGWALVGRLPGTLLGAILVARLPARLLALTLAVVVLVGVAVTARGWRPRTSKLALVTAGAASGVMGTTASIGGPPMALVWQESPGPRLRGTMSAFFLVGSALSLMALSLVGAVTMETISKAGTLLPAVLIGYAASRFVNRRLDQPRLRRFALVVSTAGALALIVEQLG